MEEKNNSLLSKFFGDAIIIAFITGLGYYATYLTELSHIKYFGLSIDSNLISPSITEIISISFTIFILTILCLQISKPIYRIIGPKTESKENILRLVWSIFSAYWFSFIFVKIIIFRKISLSFVVEWIAIFFILSLIICLLSLIGRGKKLEPKESILDDLFLK